MPESPAKAHSGILVALMNLDEFTRLASLQSAVERCRYARGLRPQLGGEFYETYDSVQVYVSHDCYHFKPVTVREFLDLYRQPGFDEAVKEIIDVADLTRTLEELDMDEEPLVLLAFVLAVIDDLELEFEDIVYITSLGGPRGRSAVKSHDPILKPIRFDESDIACTPENTVDGQCVFYADMSLIRNSYEELLRTSNFLEIYVKSTRHHSRKSWKLTGRYLLLSKLADHLDNPHIQRIFIQETGDLAGRINARPGDFRRSLIRNLRGNLYEGSAVTELVTKLSSSLSIYRTEVDGFYEAQEQWIEQTARRIDALVKKMDGLEKEIIDKSTVERHLRFVKMLDVTFGSSEYWERTYEDTKDAKLKQAIDELGGRDLNTVYDQSLYAKCTQFNSDLNRLDTLLRGYILAKENLLRTLRKRRVLFDDITEREVAAKFADLKPLFAQVSDQRDEFDGFAQSYAKSVSGGGFDQVGHAVAAYNSLDRQFINDVRKARMVSIQEMLNQFDDVGLTNILIEDGGTKTLNFGIRLNPIKIPTPRDIARELGGVFDTAGNVVSAGGQVVVNIFEAVRKGGEDLFGELNRVKLYIEEEGPKFEKYIRRDLGADIEEGINNILIKPINWLFCGGRQPPDEPSENDGCYQGGLECTQGADGTSCRLTDAHGNPSEVPGPQERITEEQLQWMRQVDQQDLLNSQDFSGHLRAWMADAAQASIFRSMLISNHADLLARIDAGYGDNAEIEAEIAAAIRGQASVVDLISAGVGAAAKNVVEAIGDMMNIVKTVEDARAVFNLVGEHGALALVDQIGDAMVAYWDEYQITDDIGKAEIIGRVASDVAMMLLPAGAAARLGRSTLRAAASTSTFRRVSLNMSERIQRHLGRVSGDRLANYMGELRAAGRNTTNFDFTRGGIQEMEFMKECWVGAEFTTRPYRDHPGRFVYISRDKTKIFREPVRKRDGRLVANFQWRKEPDGPWLGNAHMEIDEIKKMIISLQWGDELVGHPVS